MNLKWHKDISCRPPSQLQLALQRMTRMRQHECNGAKVLALGLTLDSLDALDSDQGSAPQGSNESKDLAWVPTLDALD